jgi:hypothetical protein
MYAGVPGFKPRTSREVRQKSRFWRFPLKELRYAPVSTRLHIKPDCSFGIRLVRFRIYGALQLSGCHLGSR